MGKVNHKERRFDFILYDIKYNEQMNKACFHKFYDCSMGSNLNYLFRIKT